VKRAFPLPFANFVIDAEKGRAMLSAVASNGSEKTLTQNKNTMKTQNTLTDEQITDAGHDSDMIPQVRALCAFLDCHPDELSKERHDHYGMPVFSYGRAEYAIASDSEADSAAFDYVKGSAWAFNASFILSECELPDELDEAIKAMQEKQCEGANDAILAMIEKCTTLESFVQSAISADGRGHFLSSYDGEENEEGEFFIYRTN